MCRRMAEITWLDITNKPDPWISLEEALEMTPAKMQTLGWIIYDSGDHIIIASTIDTLEDMVGDVNCIPKGTILEIVLLPESNIQDFCDK